MREQQLKGIKKFLLKVKEETVPIKVLVDYLALKKIEIPGDDLKRKTDFLVALKNRHPDVLESLEVDPETSTLLVYRNKIVENYDYSREDALHSKIWEMVSNIKTIRFKLSDVIEKAEKMDCSIQRQKVKFIVTYVIFNRFEAGKFVYDSADTTYDTILNTSQIVDEEMWRLPLQPTGLKERKALLNVEVVYFRNLNRFSVQLSETAQVFEKIERKLNSLQPQEIEKPEGGWKVGHACMVKARIGDKTTWARGCIRNVECPEREIFRIYCFDYGYWMCSRAAGLKFLPKKLFEVPPCALQCTLDASDYDVLSFEGPRSAESFSKLSKRLFLSLENANTQFGVPINCVNLYVLNEHHGFTYIMDYQID